MTAYQGADEAFDWDLSEGDLDEGPRFRTVEPGYYPFSVHKLERTHYDGSAKIPPCPMAKLTLMVQDTDGTDALASCRLYLAKSMLWKVAQFMEAIGRGKNESGKTIIDWSELEGRNGWVRLSKRSYTGSDGQERETNDVEAFCLPAEQQRAYDEYVRACNALAQQAHRQSAPAASQAPQAVYPATYPPQGASAPQAAPQATQAGYQQPSMQGMPAPQPGWGIQ